MVHVIDNNYRNLLIKDFFFYKKLALQPPSTGRETVSFSKRNCLGEMGKKRRGEEEEIFSY
jgi:hypothetical protein